MRLVLIGTNMSWSYFAFLFLFSYSALFAVNIRYHHANEVLNAITHDHIYHMTALDFDTYEVYFEKPLVRLYVSDHFNRNMKNNNYEYTITFYTNGHESSEGERSRFFSLHLVCPLGLGLNFDKTFTYQVS